MTYFRAWGTIMGPSCLTAVFGMGTGVTSSVCSPEAWGGRFGHADVSNGSGEGCALFGAALPRLGAGARLAWPRGFLVPACLGEGEVNAVKRLAVSTGQLSALLHVHLPPIDLVVFQEPMSHKGTGGLILR